MSRGCRETGRGPKLPPPVPLFSWPTPFNLFWLLNIKHCWVLRHFPSPIFPSSHPSILCYKLRHALKGKDGKGQLMLASTRWTHVTIPFYLYTSRIGYVEIYLPERSNANRLSSWAIFGKISFSMDVGLSCVAKQTARKKFNKPSIASPYQISK